MTAFDTLLSALETVLSDYYILTDVYVPDQDSKTAHVETAKLLALHHAYCDFKSHQMALEQGAKRDG